MAVVLPLTLPFRGRMGVVRSRDVSPISNMMKWGSSSGAVLVSNELCGGGFTIPKYRGLGVIQGWIPFIIIWRGSSLPGSDQSSVLRLTFL